LLTLERSNYVHRDPHSGRYRVGLRLFDLAGTALGGIAERELASPYLRQLMQATRLTAHMAILEQDEVLLVEKIDPPGLPRPATWIGKRMDLHCTAVGKALIAYLPDDEVDRLVLKHGLLRHNDNTISSLKRLKQELAAIRVQGYSVDDEEEEIGVRCIGAPVFKNRNEAAAAISVTGTTEQIDAETFSQLTVAVKQTAAAISERLAASPAGAASSAESRERAAAAGQ
jgi:DNA-binding IclR family transcriptional regulator